VDTHFCEAQYRQSPCLSIGLSWRRLYLVMYGYAANVSEKICREFVDTSTRHGTLVRAETALTIEQATNTLSSLWACHVQLNHPSPTAMLALLERSLPRPRPRQREAPLQ
jgi:hypothetical protein